MDFCKVFLFSIASLKYLRGLLLNFWKKWLTAIFMRSKEKYVGTWLQQCQGIRYPSNLLNFFGKQCIHRKGVPIYRNVKFFKSSAYTEIVYLAELFKLGPKKIKLPEHLVKLSNYLLIFEVDNIRGGGRSGRGFWARSKRSQPSAWEACLHVCGYQVGNSVADPWHFGVDPDPDPAIFVIDLQDANKKHRFFCLLLLKVN